MRKTKLYKQLSSDLDEIYAYETNNAYVSYAQKVNMEFRY